MDRDYILDNPSYHSLIGPHRRFATSLRNAHKYPEEMAGRYGVPNEASPQDWADLATLVGPEVAMFINHTEATPPEEWEVVKRGNAAQMIAGDLLPQEDPETIRLGSADVPEMLDLVARTKPGPFRARTVDMGVYLGIRHSGALVAMAGERLHPAGWAEISAVCTHPDYRGRGLASRVVRAVAAAAAERGDQVFLHVTATNTPAMRLYESLGMTVRRQTRSWTVKTPGA